MNLRIFFTAFVLVAFVAGCSTDFEVYAPEKEIRSVYCVLNPNDSVQYVRVAKAFQYNGDALQYAAANDLSVSGLTVRLKSGNKTWTAVQVDATPRDSGIFIPYHTVYQFTTDGSGAGRDTLIEGNTYKLEIGAEEEPGYITGETTIPAIPRLKGELSVVAGAGNSRCLPKLALERKFNLVFTKGAEGVNYEVRVGFNFERNGVPMSSSWGPTEIFDENRRCNDGSGNICFQFGEKELLRSFLRNMPPELNVSYTYNTQDSCVPQPNLQHQLPKSLWFETTAVDKMLSNYMTVNNPKFTDLTGTKPEYTNLTGNIDVVGVIGSISIDRKYAILGFCGEALLGLNGRPRPAGCAWE